MGNPSFDTASASTGAIAGQGRTLVRGRGLIQINSDLVTSHIHMTGVIPSKKLVSLLVNYRVRSTPMGVAQSVSHWQSTVGFRDSRSANERRQFRWDEWMTKEHGASVVQMAAWRSRRNHVRGALDVDEFGPDAVPVFGPKIPAADLVVSGPLDGYSELWRRLAVGVPVPPLPNLDVTLDADEFAKLSDGKCSVCGEVFVQSHADIVAGATDFASSKCSCSVGYRAGMDTDAIQKHRRKRLEDAVTAAGGKAALGRLLGYADGAFVGQMLRGERPVKEDTVLKLESKPGFRGWFGERAAAASPGDLTPLEADLLAAFRSIPDDEQVELVQHTMSQAERYNNLVKRELERRGLAVSGFVSATRAADTLPPAPQAKKPPKIVKTEGGSSKRVSSLLSGKAKEKRKVG